MKPMSGERQAYKPALIDLHYGVDEDANVDGLQVRGNVKVGY